MGPVALVAGAVVLGGCGDGTNDGPPEPMPTYGPSCCAIIVHGVNCGWNYSSMGKWNVLFALGLVGDEDSCETHWDDYLQDRVGTTCDGQTAGDTTARCIDDSGIADDVLVELATPNQYDIPVDYPQLAGEVGAIAEFESGVGDFLMEGIAYGFSWFSWDNNYVVSFGGDDMYDDRLTIHIATLQQGVYTGSESEDPASASFRYLSNIFSTTYDGSITVDVKGLSELAVWAEFSGTMCDLSDNCIDVSGRFSAARPDVWVR